ncbi:MCP four helix bundle domain-containing protein [Duganella sp. sic0402]|nr:methyl-accepting chemotaxis protein [Duganella sp. sic0402]MBV7538707.1 MCP four helix bundle domain-containing protein [Duganella sp. sic0402]
MRQLSYRSAGIARRLHLVCGALSLAFAGAAVFAYFNLNHVMQLARQTENLRVPQLQRVSTTELEVTRVLLLLRQSILARNEKELKRQLDGIGDKHQQISVTMQAYQQNLLTEEERARFSKVPQLLETFWAVAAEDTHLILAGQKEEALAFLMDKTVPARTELLAALRDAVKLQGSGLRDELSEVVSEAQRTLAVLVVLAGVSIVGLGFLSWHVAKVLQQRLAVSRAVAERVRDGDLSLAVRDDAIDEFSPLLTALNDMQRALTKVVSNVRTNSENVASASADIAHGSQALSARTEQQASALQQTAATMEQLGETVRTNADSAVQARQLALGASTVAARGGAVIGQVIVTMQEIQGSATRIADIIGVIDGIAFQTNILALNAAVEAARAGEQGRGFAVVANEVRNLAQRSATAAHEIKELIASCVKQVSKGSALVGEAGATMDEIVAAINRVVHIATEISAASAEQSSSVGQIGQAVAQMDRVTQQNAALVDESAGAAASLKGQAAQLVMAVAVFKQGAEIL